MSGWNPGDGRHEEVSFEPAEPVEPAKSPWWLSRPRLVMLSVGLACGLLIGGLVGVAVVGEADDRQETEAALEPTVVAGIIEKIDSGDGNGPAFALQLRNSGDETVEVKGLRFDDLDSELVAVKRASLRPGNWGYVRFAAPARCIHEPPPTLGSVRLTVRGPEGEREQEIRLPAGGDQSLLDYLAVRCAPQLLPRPQDLAGGAWVVEEAFGDQSFVDIMVWRFGRDGSFLADPEGLALLDVEHGVEGRYSLEDGELWLDADGGYGGCRRGDRSIWRPSLVQGTLTPPETPQMSVAWLSGNCPDDMKGQIWILRHLLLDDAP